jgi:uncharacterized membrane protein
MNLVIAVFFLMRGAWPVTPFMGADVLILAWAFSSTSKAATRREEVHLTRSELRVDLYPARGEPRHVALNPYWVRVQLDATPSGQNAITLATHGRKLQIGSFLALQDKASFVKALTQALSFARQAV